MGVIWNPDSGRWEDDGKDDMDPHGGTPPGGTVPEGTPLPTWPDLTGQTTTTPPPPPATTTPPPSNGGGGGGGLGAYENYYAWGGPMAPDLSWLKDAPTFTFGDFQAPGAEGMFADPGYQFRLDQGRKALEQSAAGKGTLRTGGTLKDILGYGQNMASQEYGNVFNRALNAYSTNLGTAKERYAPSLASWQNDQAARQSASNQAFNRAWDVYTYSHPSATAILNAGAGLS